MALITTGKGFIQDLEKSGALALYGPLEGGFEGRYLRRVRAAGYTVLCITAKGLGDPAAYLTGIHGVRPPHLGKKNIAKVAAVGEVQYLPPLVTYQLEHLPAKSKGLVLWIIEGNILSSQEVGYLIALTREEKRLKVAIEMGGDRSFRWLPLEMVLAKLAS